MIGELMTNARLQELELSERQIAHRREWARLRKVERLERQLAVAKARLQTMSPAHAS